MAFNISCLLIFRTIKGEDREEDKRQEHHPDAEAFALAEVPRQAHADDDADYQQDDHADPRDGAQEVQKDPPLRFSRDFKQGDEVVDRYDSGPAGPARLDECLPHAGNDQHDKREVENRNNIHDRTPYKKCPFSEAERTAPSIDPTAHAANSNKGKYQL